MSEKIAIQAVSDIKTSKAGREYFTFEDMEQKRYVCFIIKLKEFCKVGSEIDADLTPGKSADDSPRLDLIYVNGKPVIEAEAKKTGRSYGKSKEELTQIKELAEAQNRSIQAQVALKLAVDMALAENSDMPNDINAIKQIAKEFYQLLQSLTLISEAEVIHKKIEEAKGETKKAQISQETAPVKPPSPDAEVVADEDRPHTTGEEPVISKDTLLEFVCQKKKWKTKTTAETWIRNIVKIPQERIDNEPAQVLEEIKELMN